MSMIGGSGLALPRYLALKTARARYLADATSLDASIAAAQAKLDAALSQAMKGR